MENETANKALDVIVAITDERDSWQARCIAAEVALVVARRERDEATFLIEHLGSYNSGLIDERNTAKADRDAARTQAAGLRVALTQVSKLAGNWQTQDQIYDIMREALDTPGPTIGEIKAGALESLAEHNDEAISRMTSPRAAAQVLRAEAARLRGGGK